MNKIEKIKKVVEKKEKEITKLLIEYCDARIEETPKLKNSHYKKIKKDLESNLKDLV